MRLNASRSLSVKRTVTQRVEMPSACQVAEREMVGVGIPLNREAFLIGLKTRVNFCDNVGHGRSHPGLDGLSESVAGVNPIG